MKKNNSFAGYIATYLFETIQKQSVKMLIYLSGVKKWRKERKQTLSKG